MAHLPYVGKVDRILKVDFGTAEYVLLKMKWFKPTMNAQRTGMLKDNCGMYVVDHRSEMRSDRAGNEPFLLVSPKIKQVFLCELPNTQTRMVVVGARARGRNVVFDEGEEEELWLNYISHFL